MPSEATDQATDRPPRAVIAPGDVYGLLTVLDTTARGPRGGMTVECSCACGTRATYPRYDFTRARKPRRDCGCQLRQRQQQEAAARAALRAQRHAAQAAERPRELVIGTVYGHLRLDAIERTGRRVDARCECVCGKTLTVPAYRIRAARQKSCGCRRDEAMAAYRQPRPLRGTTFGAWEVVEETTSDATGDRRCRVRCTECGATRSYSPATLRDGKHGRCACQGRPIVGAPGVNHVGRTIKGWRVEARLESAARWLLRCPICSTAIIATTHRLTRKRGLDVCACRLAPEAVAQQPGQPARRARPGNCGACGQEIAAPPKRPPDPDLVLKYLRETCEKVWDLPERQAEDKALTIMRCLPGVTIRLPDLTAVEKLARDLQVTRRFLRDPSPAAVAHACDFFDIERKDATRMLKARNGGIGLARLRERQSATPGLNDAVNSINVADS